MNNEIISRWLDINNIIDVEIIRGMAVGTCVDTMNNYLMRKWSECGSH